MAKDLASVEIPANGFVDLYAATGITVGVQLTVQNISNQEALLYEDDAQPSETDGHNVIGPGEDRLNGVGDIGAWAFSKIKLLLQVAEA